MAWERGNPITALKLNAENTDKKSAYSCSNDWGTAAVNATYHFIHQDTGRFMYLRTSGTSYWWAKGDAIVYFRNSVGAVTEHRLWYEAGIKSKTLQRTVNVQDFGHGSGWYSGRVWVDRGYGYIDVYWGQDNCWPGGKLVYWDNPTSSGNKIPGELLTAAILNTGRVGVI